MYDLVAALPLDLHHSKLACKAHLEIALTPDCSTSQIHLTEMTQETVVIGNRSWQRADVTAISHVIVLSFLFDEPFPGLITTQQQSLKYKGQGGRGESLSGIMLTHTIRVHAFLSKSK